MRVLLVDDHAMMRAGLKELLRQHGEVTIVGETGDGRQAVEMARRLHPDVVIMDIALPGLNGIEATRQIVASNPDVGIVALSVYSDGDMVSDFFKAGGRAYVPKESIFEELRQAVDAACVGETYVSSRVSKNPVAGALRNLPGPNPSPFAILTPREREVLQLLAEGLTAKQAAVRLGISSKTVQTFRASLMVKLKANTVADLTRYALRQRLTSPDR